MNRLLSLGGAVILYLMYVVKDQEPSREDVLEVVSEFLERVVYWQEGKPDLHAVKQLVKKHLKR